MNGDDTGTKNLGDLNVRTIRANNDQVDERMTELEEKADELRDELAEKKATIEQKDEEIEQATTLINQFRDTQRDKLLKRIRQANEAVSEDQEVDLGPLEEADVTVLEAVAEQVETLASASAESAGVSNQGSGPDLGGVDPSDVSNNGTDINEEFAEAARDLGLEEDWKAHQNGEFADDVGPVGSSTEDNSPGAALESAIKDIASGGEGGL